MPKKNVAYTIDIGLVDQSNRPQFKSSPTLASGDFKVSLDGGNYANLGTLPTVVNSGKVVRVVFSQSEMDHDTITLVASDAAGGEWDDQIITFNTTANSIDDVYTAVQSVLTKLLKYVQLMLRKDSAIATDNATELTAINADGGSGAGGYANSSDSQEGIRDSTLAASIADKTGFKLASDGLDAVAVTAPTGVATTFPAMMVQVWRRFFKKVVVSTTEIKTYANDGTTVITTQTRAETSTTQTQGTAT